MQNNNNIQLPPYFSKKTLFLEHLHSVDAAGVVLLFIFCLLLRSRNQKLELQEAN